MVSLLALKKLCCFQSQPGFISNSICNSITSVILEFPQQSPTKHCLLLLKIRHPISSQLSVLSPTMLLPLLLAIQTFKNTYLSGLSAATLKFDCWLCKNLSCKVLWNLGSHYDVSVFPLSMDNLYAAES